MGVRKRINLRLSLSGTTEERQDRWAVYSNDFGFFVYGTTEEEAHEAFERAMSALVESFQGDEEAIKRWLDHKGLNYTLSVTLEFKASRSAAPATPPAELFEREFEKELIPA